MPELPPLQDDRERLLEMPLDAIDPDALVFPERPRALVALSPDP